MIREGIFFCCFSFLLLFSSFEKFQQPTTIRYLPLGDSYTICTGATEKESWPYLLTEHLNKSKKSCLLLDNPARIGYTTAEVIKRELPLVKKLKPDFVTLLIGVNDWVREVPKETFQKNLIYILDEVQNDLPDKKRIMLLTIPDFGVTSVGKVYSGGRDISAGITEFNDLIRAEAKKRGLTLVDLFPTSQKMGTDQSLVSPDGLHPSAKEYAIWESLIFPQALTVLK